jgi:wobble nucleotide-excising tRNase
MRIEKVEKINHGSFRNYTWPAGLADFGNVNILLGWNGSGKTTTSRILRSCEAGLPLTGSQFRIKLDNSTITETSDLTPFEDQIRVFNDEYVSDVLSSKSGIPQVFYVGKEAVDFSKEEEELSKKEGELTLKKCNNRHDEIAQSVAESIRRVTGINSCKKELSDGNYSAYSKADFEKRIKDFDKKITEGVIADISDFVQDDVQSLQKELVSETANQDITTSIENAEAWILSNQDSIHTCLETTPQQETSARIEAFEDGQQKWVREGVDLHYTDTAHLETCLFCDSKITNKDELLKHFSDEVVKVTNEVSGYHIKAKGLKDDLNSKKPRANGDQEGKINSLIDTLDTLIEKLVEKKEKITSKVSSPSSYEVVESSEEDSSVDTDSVAHRIERHYVAEKYTSYNEQKTTFGTCWSEREVLVDEIKEIKESIKVLEAKAQNTHQAAEKLNNLFKTAFPYRNIEITDNDDRTGYVLKRDGNNCSFLSLSEGERNLIALAYFITSLNDDNKKFADDGVVVIDDPVSSLDKNSIFQIFSLITQEIKERPNRQYIIFTHNLDFFGHLRENYRRKIDHNDYPLYSVKLTDAGSQITEIHKLLKEHRSDYYYVFNVLHDHKDTCDLDDAYLMVNLLRRWLETFLEFKFSLHGDLRDQVKLAYDKAKEIGDTFNADPNEIYRFINHGSHGFSSTETVDESVLNGASQRISEAFKMVEILDPLHHEKLMSRIT